jgi:UDPglucose--hexose-1-phosphate uridylyltransferase
MSILRRDPVSLGWVIYPSDRPFHNEHAQEDEVRDSPDQCPFCPGHEAETLPEISAYRAPGSAKNSAGWRVRTVPNKYALLRIEGKFDRRGEGLYDMMNAVGAHEVLIETPDHNGQMHEYTLAAIEEILRMARDRVADLTLDTRFRYIQVFRNHRRRAGESLSHPTSQIIALPVVPRWVREEINQARDHWLQKERCIFCDIINQDSAGPRMICDNESFVALTPYASRFPYEFWIYPKDHTHLFHTTPDMGLAALADILRTTLGALYATLDDPAYNLIVHQAPVQPEKFYHDAKARVNDFYHWHIEVLPRVVRVSGFEYGTGFYVNPVLPETAAAQYRARIRVLDDSTGRLKVVD